MLFKTLLSLFATISTLQLIGGLTVYPKQCYRSVPWTYLNSLTCRYEFVRSFSSIYSYQPVFTTSSFQFKYIAKNSYKIPESPECPEFSECPESPECPKLPECPELPEAPESPESPDCKGEKLSDLSEYQKLANIQYQRDVRGVWISGKESFYSFCTVAIRYN